MKILSGAMSSLFKLPEEIAKSGFEVEIKSGEIRDCLLMIVPYCHDIFKSDVYVCSSAQSCKTANLRWVPQHLAKCCGG